MGGKIPEFLQIVQVPRQLPNRLVAGHFEFEDRVVNAAAARPVSPSEGQQQHGPGPEPDVSRCLGCRAKLRPESIEIVTEPLLVARILLAPRLYGRAPARDPPRSARLFDDIDQQQHEAD